MLWFLSVCRSNRGATSLGNPGVQAAQGVGTAVMTTSFASLPLKPELLKNLSTLGYEEMTEIQAECLPTALEGRDLIAQAKTGSGKTAAFGLALLQRLDVSRICVQSMVLCPTRELADQVAKELRRLARAIPNVKVQVLCGGGPLGPQFGALEHGVHIVVGTPGRVLDLLQKRRLDLRNLSALVFDEADRMLDMGFSDSIESIVYECPRERQTLLFSATYPNAIEQLSSDYQNEPLRVEVASRHSLEQIEQQLITVESDSEKMGLAHRLICEHRPESCLIFCATKRQTDAVADSLCQRGWAAYALHGDMEQRQRDETLARFANKSCTVLVATDVAARGLDVQSIELVINFDLPRDPEDYVHRIGRTGRAGAKGRAVSMATRRQDPAVHRLEDYLGHDIPTLEESKLRTAKVVDQAPKMVTIVFDAGKKNKLRPGDILGALTREDGVKGEFVGKIDIFPYHAYVAVHRSVIDEAFHVLRTRKIKGRNIRVRELDW